MFASGSIAGIKHTNLDLYEMERLRAINPELKCFGGFENEMVAFLAMGCDGFIGSTFNFRRFASNRELALVFLTLCVFFIGYNCYFIHIMNWMNYTLGFNDPSLILGIPLLIAVAISVPFVKVINNKKVPAVAAFLSHSESSERKVEVIADYKYVLKRKFELVYPISYCISAQIHISRRLEQSDISSLEGYFGHITITLCLKNNIGCLSPSIQYHKSYIVSGVCIFRADISQSDYQIIHNIRFYVV